MSKEKTEVELLKEELFMENQHTAKVIDDAEMSVAFEFCEGYKKFLNACKTCSSCRIRNAIWDKFSLRLGFS